MTIIKQEDLLPKNIFIVSLKWFEFEKNWRERKIAKKLFEVKKKESEMKFMWTLLILLVAGRCHAIDNRDLYDTVVQGVVSVPLGNEESLLVNLQSPIHFYTEKYDSIYVSFPIRTFFLPYTTQVPCAVV